MQGGAGVWKTLENGFNFMAANITDQVRAIAEVVTAVQLGDFSKKITLDAKVVKCSVFVV